jgi:hypothetical protein
MADFSSKGPVHQQSCIETPQQNAIVEHKHLLNVARALRFQAHLSLFFWGNCKLTVVHLINRIPTLHLSNKSPYEILFSITPTYSIPISTYLDVYVMHLLSPEIEQNVTLVLSLVLSLVSL